MSKSNHKPYMISEIGLNHNGDLEEGYKLIKASKSSNCDAVKFQIRSESFFLSDIKSMEISLQYVYEYIENTFLNFDQYLKLFEYSRSLGLEVIVSCWDIESLEFAKNCSINILKIASADLTNTLLIETAFKYFDNFIMSTGMSTQAEIEKSVNLFLKHKKNLTLLHCQSAYPAPVNSLNLNYLKTLRNLYPEIKLGYSGHELEYDVCLAALALGASVFEKHLTLNKAAKGNDHVVSLYPNEMRDLCNKLNFTYESLGSHAKREIQPGEKMNRVSLAKSLTVNRKLNKGQILNKEHLDFTYGGRGLSPNKYSFVIGKTLNIDKNPGEYLEESDLEELNNLIKFKKQPIKNCIFGIPVRYHDAQKLHNEINPHFLEFHLSYKDINYPIEKIFKFLQDLPSGMKHTFHSPDFYANDLIFDPFSEDSFISKKSDEEFNNFLCHIQKVKSHLRLERSYKVPVITSFSSATLKEFYPLEKTNNLYEKLYFYIKELNKKYKDLKILPQTLPVNAWYLGGRRIVNLFADPRLIYKFCKKYKMKICLDTAHTIMSSNFYKLDPTEWLIKLLEFADHVHLVDAKGDSDEGLNFGDGDLNLLKITTQMNFKKGLTYIPEIWQGHHNMGEGFKKALSTLTEL